MTLAWRLRFDLRGWWHVGTGQGRGAELDAVVQRSPEGLPIIPGRTVKGLVRDVLCQAEELGRIPEGAAVALCGTALPPPPDVEELDPDVLLAHRFETEAGAGWFGSAELGDDWNAWAATLPPDVLAGLYDRLYATAINDTGQVVEHTLRCVEVAAPMVLRAPLRIASVAEDFPNWREVLGTALPLLRSLGVRRNRGLGRVRVTLETGA